MTDSHPTEQTALEAAYKYMDNNLPIKFDGMNCNDYLDDINSIECTGWDGSDRRCECGNRRVSWDIEKNPDGTYYAVARAY